MEEVLVEEWSKFFQAAGLSKTDQVKYTKAFTDNDVEMQSFCEMVSQHTESGIHFMMSLGVKPAGHQIKISMKAKKYRNTPQGCSRVKIVQIGITPTRQSNIKLEPNKIIEFTPSDNFKKSTGKNPLTIAKASDMKTKISEVEKAKIVQECVEDKVSPVSLAKKWNCSAKAIRTWVRSTGKQLPKKYKKSKAIPPKNKNTNDTEEDVVDKDLHQNEDNIARPLLKRRCHQETIPRKAKKLTEVNIQTLDLCNSPPLIEQVSSGVCDDGLDKNVNVICISDDKDSDKVEYMEYKEQEMVKSAYDGGNNDDNKFKGFVEFKNVDNNCRELNAGKYTIVSIHIELFRSSKFSFSKITQIGCVVEGVTPVWFFKAVKPHGIEEYLDHYKLGGDLLQALHMTREDDGTFLFRSRFEAIEESKKVVCVEEREALENLLDFLETYTNCVIVGVDEDTIAILVKKLKGVDGYKSSVIVGYTYWKRVLKYLDVKGYKGIDLEKYCNEWSNAAQPTVKKNYTNMDGKDFPSYNSALDIASVVMESVKFVAQKERGGRKSMEADFFKLCMKTSFIGRPQKVDYDASSIVEYVEVYSSFRPSVSGTISAEKLEQILVSSDSDPEPEKKGQRQTGSVASVGVTCSAADMDAAKILRLPGTPKIETVMAPQIQQSGGGTPAPGGGGCQARGDICTPALKIRLSTQPTSSQDGRGLTLATEGGQQRQHQHYIGPSGQAGGQDLPMPQRGAGHADSNHLPLPGPPRPNFQINDAQNIWAQTNGAHTRDVQNVAVHPVPARPAPARPAPARPAPARPVPARPVPSRPVPAQLVPAQPVPSQPVPAQPVSAQPAQPVRVAALMAVAESMRWPESTARERTMLSLQWELDFSHLRACRYQLTCRNPILCRFLHVPIEELVRAAACQKAHRAAKLEARLARMRGRGGQWP